MFLRLIHLHHQYLWLSLLWYSSTQAAPARKESLGTLTKVVCFQKDCPPQRPFIQTLTVQTKYILNVDTSVYGRCGMLHIVSLSPVVLLSFECSLKRFQSFLCNSNSFFHFFHAFLFFSNSCRCYTPIAHGSFLATGLFA